METWKEKLTNFFIDISNFFGFNPIDLLAIIITPLVVIKIKKYITLEEEISMTTKIYDFTFLLVVIAIYIIVIIRIISFLSSYF